MLMALAIGIGSPTFAQNAEAPTSPADVISSVSAGLTPTSPFYFLDRLGEFIQEIFAFSPDAKVKLKIEFSKERIAEIKVMLEDGNADSDDIDEAQSLLADDMEDTQNIIDEEEIDDDSVLEFTALLVYEDETDDGDESDIEDIEDVEDVEDVEDIEDVEDTQNQNEREDD